MGTRRKARESALQMLYQIEIGRCTPSKAITDFWSQNEADEPLRIYANEVVNGVMENIKEIDDTISEHSTNWKISRMAAVDKNILRISTFELKNRMDVPIKVVLNEAVEIAKRFGTTESGAFVNGILDNMARKLRKGEDTSEE